jgi:hypothetical protein
MFRQAIFLALLVSISNPAIAQRLRPATQGSIEIKQAREVQPNSQEYNLSGTLRLADTKKASSLTIVVAVRYVGKAEWLVQERTAAIEINGATRAVNWFINGIHVGKKSECDKKFQILAVAVTKNTISPITLPYDILIHSGLAASNLLDVARKCPESPTPAEPKPRVHISHIGGNPVDIRKEDPLNVRLEESVHGRVVKPPDAYVQIVVQPLTGDNRWIMHGGNAGKNNIFDANAYFGRDGLDEWERFLVYAIVTRQPLPTTKIDPAQWYAFKKRLILAESPQISVYRYEPATGKGIVKTPTGIVIIHINKQEVDDRSEWEVTKQSTVDGKITGRPASIHDKVLVFVKPNNEEGTWRYIGQAILRNEDQWYLPPVFIGSPGQRFKMIAVLANKKFLDPDSDEEKRNIIAQSRPVKIVIADEAGVEITKIDNQQVTEDSETNVSRLSAIAGRLAPHAGSADDKVWVYIRPSNGEGAWRLVGGAIRKPGQSWELPPVVLGESGQRMAVIAILSKTRIESLDDAALQNVKAFSPRILIKIE